MMGRKGITYDQVAAAADALEAERSGSVTLVAMRAKLGTGSPNTIHRHLKEWEANRPKMPAPSIAIPEEVARAMTGWVMQVSTAVRADSEERAVHAQADADELARAGEDLEAERDQLQAEIVTLTTQRDQQQAMADERAAEIQRLLDEVGRERDLAGAAQVDAAQAKLRAESQIEHLAEMRSRVESDSTVIDTERAARITAERDAAVLTAQLAGIRSELDGARAQVVTLQQELAAARERFDARVHQDQALLDELRKEYEERLGEMHRALDNARDLLSTAAVDKVQLQERLVAEQERGQAIAEDGAKMLASERAMIAILEAEKADLKERLKVAEAQAKGKVEGSDQA